MKTILIKVLLALRPIIWKLCDIYEIKIERHCFAHGKNALILHDSISNRRHNIPSSVYFNTASGEIEVGANTVFGESVMVLTGMHIGISEATMSGMQLHDVPPSGRDIRIGKGCYIGSGAILIGPCSVGDYSVIGAGSVVTKDIEEYSMAVGPRAQVIKKLN